MAALLAQTPISVRERQVGLLYGALSGDSLALAAHWVYEQEELAQRFGRITDHQEPHPDGYHPGKDRGAQTHYGDQTLVLMDSLEACGGNFVMDDFARRWRGFWENNSTTYRDKSTKATLVHLEEGKGLTRAGSDILDLGGACRMAPVLLALRNEDKPTIIAAVRAQAALTHAAPAAIDTAEFIAHTVFLLMRGVSISSALKASVALPYKALTAAAYLQKAESVQELSTVEAVAELGQSCPLEKSLPSILAILLRHGDDLETALIENVMAGGDSASRGLVLGIILGAAHGRRAIPERWIESLKARPQMESFLKTVGLGCGD
jgi:ADP-ribosylglycohydrolase